MSRPRGESPVEFFGPYEMYEQLGVGGMATVHRAKKQGIAGFQREVALKRLLPHLAEDESFVSSFVREARLASYLQHANIIQIYDLGRVERVYYIAMEFVEGRDLRQILKQSAYATGPMPVSVMLALTRQLCDALDYAHTRKDEHGEPLGIVHRDISPSNLLVAADGHLKIIDFGIAKATTATLRTQSGRVKGKFAYMAPEAIRGKPLDHRSDIFAVGIVAHEMLTARPLFAAKSEYDTLQKITQLPVERPSRDNPDCPRDLDDIVLTALAKNPEERWQSAGAMLRALDHVIKQLSLLANNREVAEWMDWAFQQPLQPERVDHPALRKKSGPNMQSPAMVRTSGPNPADMDALDRASIEIVWGGGQSQGDLSMAETTPRGTDPRLQLAQQATRSPADRSSPHARAPAPETLARPTPWPQGTPQGQAGQGRPANSPQSTLYGVAPPPQSPLPQHTPPGILSAEAIEIDPIGPPDATLLDDLPPFASGAVTTPVDQAGPLRTILSEAPVHARNQPTRRSEPGPEPEPEGNSKPRLFLWLAVLVVLSAGGAAAGYFLFPTRTLSRDKDDRAGSAPVPSLSASDASAVTPPRVPEAGVPGGSVIQATTPDAPAMEDASVNAGSGPDD